MTSSWIAQSGVSRRRSRSAEAQADGDDRTAVGGLDNLEALVPAVEAPGARHATYGTTAAHYAPVGEALLWTLGQGLGDAFTPEVEAAWTKVYGVLAATMQAGAAAASATKAAE